MPGDRKNFSERGKEKASSQSQLRDFTKQRYQQNNAKSLEIDKNRVSLKGEMNQIEQRRSEHIKKAEDRAMSRYNRGSHVNKKHGDLSDRGKEQAPSQSQPRDLKNNNTNKKDAERLELDKKRVSLKGGGGIRPFFTAEEYERGLQAAKDFEARVWSNYMDMKTGGSHSKYLKNHKGDETSEQQ
jgi:hypothetical protein